MDADRWERLQSIFHAAADLPESEQRTFVENACADDPSLAVDALALIAADARGNKLLDRGVAETARDILDGETSIPNRQFGRYRITRVLGEGGMGIVYLAERSDLGAVAAIKILRDAWLSPARRERFAAEQRTLAGLNHPLIARLFDADTLDDGTPWFVMEYVEGVPITEYCASHSLSIAERLRLFRQVCEAVQYAHANLVIHRDLKPSNILVSKDGGVKLLDFGIAKQLEGLGERDSKTQTGMRMMTPAYAAPEQLTAGTIGVATDVYGLGVILYELLAGTMPFDIADRTPGQIETIITTVEPDHPSVVARRSGSTPAITRAEWADLDVLCLTAMHKDPRRRYTSVEALIRDVDHYTKGEPLDARPDSAGYRVEKFVRRHRAVVSSAVAVLALVTALVVFYTARLTVARNNAIAQAARAERVQNFTLDLFEGGDKAVGPSDTLKVIALVDRGLEKARSLDAEPATQSELYLTLGGIYQKLGKLQRADSLIQLALDRRRALLGPNHPDVAAALVALGRLRIDQAKFDDAERLIREGVAIDDNALAPNNPERIRATAALGRVLQERGAYDKAIPILVDVVRQNQAAAAPATDVATSISALADAHFYAGHYDVADSLNRQVLTMYRDAYGPRHPLVADILINLGATQQERGNYTKAEAYDRDALAITRAFYGDQHYKTADNLTMLGRALVFENRFDDAVSVLNEALAIKERVYGPVHPAVASTLNEIGNIASQRSQYENAEAAFRRMLDIYRSVYGDKHYLLAIATSNLAGTYSGRKNYHEAEVLFRDAVRRFTESQGAEHMNTGIARIKLGRALLRQSKFADAEKETHAGYDILMKQANPGISFVQGARKDLSIEYDSLGQGALAAKFRALLADTTHK